MRQISVRQKTLFYYLLREGVSIEKLEYCVLSTNAVGDKVPVFSDKRLEQHATKLAQLMR